MLFLAFILIAILGIIYEIIQHIETVILFVLGFFAVCIIIGIISAIIEDHL